MKPELPALVMPLSTTETAQANSIGARVTSSEARVDVSANDCPPSFVNRQPGQDFPAKRCDCGSDDGSCGNDIDFSNNGVAASPLPHGNGANGLQDSTGCNHPVYHLAPHVRTKKKRFG